MKKYLLLAAMAGSSLSYADVQFADDMAANFSFDVVQSVQDRLNIKGSDGPYNGEVPLNICGSVSERDDCHDYTAGQFSSDEYQHRVTDDLAQQVEDYLFYHAYRNMVSGYYYTIPDYKKNIDSIGISTVLLTEISLLKEGIKKPSYMSHSNSFTQILNIVSGANDE